MGGRCGQRQSGPAGRQPAAEGQRLRGQGSQKWAALMEPAGRVQESAEFASMPHRRPADTRDVNSWSGLWPMFHHIRLRGAEKGLCTRLPGHTADQVGQSACGGDHRCHPVIVL
ncbi:hypothetical protein CLM81_29585 [Streptomyces albidoflavus]|nr:hypothetical protein CLM81_29585 [Streptomyces albidoflavus]